MRPGRLRRGGQAPGGCAPRRRRLPARSRSQAERLSPLAEAARGQRASECGSGMKLSPSRPQWSSHRPPSPTRSRSGPRRAHDVTHPGRGAGGAVPPARDQHDRRDHRQEPERHRPGLAGPLSSLQHGPVLFDQRHEQRLRAAPAASIRAPGQSADGGVTSWSGQRGFGQDAALPTDSAWAAPVRAVRPAATAPGDGLRTVPEGGPQIRAAPPRPGRGLTASAGMPGAAPSRARSAPGSAFSPPRPRPGGGGSRP